MEQTRRRLDELERIVATLRATEEIASALAGEVDLEPILDLVATRARARVSARTLMILLPGHGDLCVSHAAGVVPDDLVGRAVPEGTVAEMLERFGLGAASRLEVPLAFHGRSLGRLVAVDRVEDGPGFSATDGQLLTSFAGIAAAAVGAAQTLTADRRRERAAAAEAERRRWARELHDETLQGIAGVRVLLASSRHAGEAELRAVVALATDNLQDELDRLRGIIHDVRPSSLDDLGLMAAVEALVARHRSDAGPTLRLDVDLDHEAGRAADRLHPDIEVAVYRIAQEALTNALKHAGARSIEVALAEIEGEVGVRIRDDGVGFDVRASPDAGIGFLGMQERVDLLGGRLRISSTPGVGTTLEARVPARHCSPA